MLLYMPLLEWFIVFHSWCKSEAIGTSGELQDLSDESKARPFDQLMRIVAGTADLLTKLSVNDWYIYPA